MDSSGLLQALKALHAQFATFKSTSLQERASLQQQLALSHEQNQRLEVEVLELTQEVQALKERLAEEANRKDEFDVVRSLQAEFDGFELAWGSGEAMKKTNEEEERLALANLQRDAGREVQPVTTRPVDSIPSVIAADSLGRTVVVSSLIEQPVLNRANETVEIPPPKIVTSPAAHLMDSSELHQALNDLRSQLTYFKSTSTREKARLQQQLNLAHEQNKTLEAEVRELTQEVCVLKEQLEQAGRKDELDLVKSLRAEFDGLQQTWESEEVMEIVEGEEERLRVLALEMSKRDSDRKTQPGMASRTLAIPSSIEQPVLNRARETPEIYPAVETITLKVYRLAFRLTGRSPVNSGITISKQAGRSPVNPGITISKQATVQVLIDFAEKICPNESQHPRRYWKVGKSATQIDPQSLCGAHYPVYRIRSDNAVTFGETGRSLTLTLGEDSWLDGDAVVIETKKDAGWLVSDDVFMQ